VRRLAICKWLQLDIEGEFTLSRVSGRLAGMSSLPQHSRRRVFFSSRLRKNELSRVSKVGTGW
jgi:hypothetical protein